MDFMEYLQFVIMAVQALAVYVGHIAVMDVVVFLYTCASELPYMELSDFLFPIPREWMFIMDFFKGARADSGFMSLFGYFGGIVFFLCFVGTFLLMIYAFCASESVVEAFKLSFFFTLYATLLVFGIAIIIMLWQDRGAIFGKIGMIFSVILFLAIIGGGGEKIIVIFFE